MNPTRQKLNFLMFETLFETKVEPKVELREDLILVVSPPSTGKVMLQVTPQVDGRPWLLLRLHPCLLVLSSSYSHLLVQP